MLWAIHFITTLTIQLVVYLCLVFVALVVVLKVCLEPVKGVCKCTSKLHGRVALVTGGNSGLGLETARELTRRGARVIIASRDANKSQQAIADIVSTTSNTQVEYRQLDLSKFSNIKQFAEEFNKQEPRLDILVNNSGCAGLEPHITEDGIDIVTQINYFGAFLLTNLLLEKLIASKPSRIVIVSSVGHRFCTFDPEDLAGIKANTGSLLNSWTVYARSKLLQVLWTRALAKRLPLGVTVNAAHPGIVKTDIFNRLPAFVKDLIKGTIGLVFKTPLEGAQTMVHLCVAPELADASGGYYADCKPATTARIVKDDKVVERVWNESLMLTKNKL
ncbi:retinol dehydrogenase 12-like [Pectinophora gossypiella]|uniref:retinol dehydrogenase 12-like n=1 Tax=Pectinophora gossypiella TaxID=13191 RepID=UPI00214EF57A|nr:retinol dehydrogenase 12-like [Pectinophora gossypiella]